QIVAAVVQEDARVLGLSILSGAHNQLVPAIMENLKKAGASDIIVFLGGIIPDADLPFLKDLGVREVFQPGTNTNDVVSFIKKEVGR
ncbi:MAG: cobalamin B12-binding domain-containing protein, partial [Holophagaceae bacterium]